MGSQEKMTSYLAKRAALAAEQPADGICWQRISQLLDTDSFVELDSLVTARGLAFGPARPKVAGDGVRTGYGTIDGRLVYIAAQDPDVYGGSLGQAHADKISKAIQLACLAQVPFIGLYDSGGARIEEGILGLEGMANLLAALDLASGQIPLLAAVFGPLAGGAAFLAANSDFVLMAEKGSGIFMNGPMVVSASENKSLSAVDVGGGAVHAEKTGLADLVATDADGLLGQIKNLLAYVPDSCDGFIFPAESTDDPNRTESRLDELASAFDSGYTMAEIIDLVVDKNSFLALKARYAPGMITGLAKLDGRTVAVLAQADSRSDLAMLAKAKKLVHLCQQLNLPLLNFVDTEGLAISLEQEQQGLAAAGADLMKAMLRLEVPRLAVIVGKAIGSAYLLFAGKACGTDLVYAWPTAEIAVVNSDTAAHIIYRKEIAAAADPITARQDFADKYAAEIAAAEVAAACGHVDEIITPSATRPRLISALAMLTAEI